MTWTSTQTATSTVTATPSFTPYYTRTPTLTFTATPTFTSIPPLYTETPMGSGCLVGQATPGGTPDYGSTGLIELVPYNLPVTSVVYSLGADIALVYPNSPIKFQMALYADNGLGTAPTSLIAQSEVRDIVAGWNQVDLPDHLLAPGTYWIGQTAGYNTTLKFKKADGLGAYQGPVTFGQMPATFTGYTFTPYGHYNMVMNVCNNWAPTPTPVSGGNPQLLDLEFSQNPFHRSWASYCAGIITLDQPARSGGATVSLTSSSTSVASVPYNVVVPAGSLHGYFALGTAGDGSTTITANLSASILAAPVTYVP